MIRLVFLIFALVLSFVCSYAQSVPNIVIILSDDQGYADISFNPEHSPELKTPNLDALASEGVFFNQAYTSSPVCSPTRAGIMLGGYHQRVGVFTSNQGEGSFDPSIPIFPFYLPDDYRSTAIGKWHLGLDNDSLELKWHALNRGFDECYYFMGRGGHDYFEIDNSNSKMYRNLNRLNKDDLKSYLTTQFTNEAVEFIEREKSRPFFLYLAYNAVHAPAQAPRKDIELYKKMYPKLSENRIIMLAMLHHLDEGVGAVVNKLKEENLWDNTLLFYLTDNGGDYRMESDNGSLRGSKGSLYEGGIRTPFIVSWPAEFEGGKVIDAPIISFDILPTVLSAIGVTYYKDDFDGRNILPLICEGEKSIHDKLFWDMGDDYNTWAIRKGNTKIVSVNNKVEVYNLKNDPYEQTNLILEKTVEVEKAIYHHRLWYNKIRNNSRKY